MALPKRIQEQLDAATALEAQLEAERAAQSPLVTKPSDLTPPQPLPTPPSPAQPQAEPPPPPPAPPKEDFEQKYKTLQGMYSAEVKQMRALMAEQGRQIEQLAQKVKPAEEPAPAKPVTDPKDVEQFGADLIEMVQRYVTNVAQTIEGKHTELAGRVSALERQVTGVSEQTAASLEQQFYMTLQEQVPDWKEVNADPRWLLWLGETDPVYGAPRQAALDSAQASFDARRVAHVFKAFKATLPAAPVPESLASQQTPPSTAADATPIATQPPQVLSQKFIMDFYNDVTRGRYAGREAEAQAIEASIESAVAEGRVR